MIVKLIGGAADGEQVYVGDVKDDIYIVSSDLREISVTKITDPIKPPLMVFHKYSFSSGDTYKFIGEASREEASRCIRAEMKRLLGIFSSAV